MGFITLLASHTHKPIIPNKTEFRNATATAQTGYISTGLSVRISYSQKLALKNLNLVVSRMVQK